jgi:phospholipid/cholesterol/gamma-HCH transport system permease protein
MENILHITRNSLEILGDKIIRTIRSLGDWVEFVWHVFVWTFKRPYRWVLFFDQMEFVGVRSTGIVALTAFFTGAVFALQAGKVYALFNMESLVGATVGLSLTREIAPVFAALMVTARACSAMAAELGSMRVTEQIDALETMAVEPLQYLIAPRVVASTIMTPLLTMLFNFVGIVGAYLVGIGILSIHEGPFMNRLYYMVDGEDIAVGIVKAAFFGFLIAAISCYQGYKTRAGAAGVGRATTRAVVVSAVTILVVDYFLTAWLLEFFIKPGR